MPDVGMGMPTYNSPLEAEAAARAARHLADQPVIDFASGAYGDLDASICEAE